MALLAKPEYFFVRLLCDFVGAKSIVRVPEAHRFHLTTSEVVEAGPGFQAGAVGTTVFLESTLLYSGFPSVTSLAKPERLLRTIEEYLMRLKLVVRTPLATQFSVAGSQVVKAGE